MKKAIKITIGVGVGTVALVGFGVLIPTIYSTSSPSPIIIKNANALYSNNVSAAANIKDAILGTTKINNGNYVLYFGSEGIKSNVNFLYDTHKSTAEDFIEKQLGSIKSPLSGNYWTATNYVLNATTDGDDIANKPQFVAYINTLGAQNTVNRNNLADEMTKLLKSIVDSRLDYSKMNLTDQQTLKDKYNFVRANIINNNNPLISVLTTELDDFISKINLNWEPDPQLRPNEIAFKDFNFTVRPNIVKYDPSPFATYTTWDKQTKKYNDDSYSNEFVDIWNFIKNVPIYKDIVKDVTNSDGVVLAFKDGKLTNKNYSGSFNEVAGDNSDTGTGNEGNSDANSDSTQKSNSKTPPPSTRSVINLQAENTTTNQDPITPPIANSFFDFLKASYSIVLPGESKPQDQNTDSNNNNNSNNQNQGQTSGSTQTPPANPSPRIYNKDLELLNQKITLNKKY